MSRRVSELFLFDILIAILKIEYVSSRFDNAESIKEENKHLKFIVDNLEGIN